MAQQQYSNRRPAQGPTEKANGTALIGGSIKALSDTLSKFSPHLQKAIPHSLASALTPQRAISLAISAATSNPELLNCTGVSIANSVVLAASLGLEFNNALGQGYLIPYKGVCTFQPGYRGLITLALRSGRVHDVAAQMVLRQDAFEYEYGTNEFLRHKPSRRGEDVLPEKDWEYAYCLVKYKEGPASFLVLDRSEILRVRNQSSQSWQKERSPWQTNFEEMVRKTPTKRHLKYCDLSAHLAKAVGLDDQAEAGLAQENAIDWSDYRDLTPGVEHEGKTLQNYVQGSDNNQAPNGTTGEQPNNSPTIDDEAKNSAALTTPGPLTQDMFSSGQWDAMSKDFKTAHPNQTIAQMSAWLGRWTATKGEAMTELQRLATENK